MLLLTMIVETSSLARTLYTALHNIAIYSWSVLATSEVFRLQMIQFTFIVRVEKTIDERSWVDDPFEYY